MENVSNIIDETILKESKRLHHEDIMTGEFNTHEIHTREEQEVICSDLFRRATVRLSTLN